MQSPLDKYPKPPFKSETQPWPGLAGKMDPKPDHGEQSYRAKDSSQRPFTSSADSTFSYATPDASSPGHRYSSSRAKISTPR